MKSREGTADDTAAGENKDGINNNNFYKYIIIIMIIVITSNSSSCNNNESNSNSYIHSYSSIKTRDNARRYNVASLLSQTSAEW